MKIIEKYSDWYNEAFYTDETIIRGITASCFDLFHSGHILMLKEAKMICDDLIVALQTDPSIDRSYKRRPIQSIYERYTQVLGCRYVDEILIYDTEEDLLNILNTVNFHVRILGEEYKESSFTGCDMDHAFFFNRRRHSWSSTNLKTRVYNDVNDHPIGGVE